jgi:hypothetical protein
VSVNRTVALLADRNAGFAARRDQHPPTSACCGAIILGAAARWCADCGAGISSADIDHETHAPLRSYPQDTLHQTGGVS